MIAPRASGDPCAHLWVAVVEYAVVVEVVDSADEVGVVYIVDIVEIVDNVDNVGVHLCSFVIVNLSMLLILRPAT